MTNGEKMFVANHPELKSSIKFLGGISKLKKYSNTDCGKLTEQWERNSNGEFIDVTAREKAREELANAMEALERINAKEA